MKQTRRLPLQALYNCRDLGGFPTAGGGVTRYGVFLRSEAPCGLPQADIDALVEYGLKETIDLRGGGEVRSRPSDLSAVDGVTYHHKSLFNEAAVFDKSQVDKPGKPGGPGGPGGLDWGEQYKSMAETSRDWAKEVLQIAADCPGALLYHCTTGKDRTGILTCYLLSIAGVSRNDIAADYCVSQVYLEPVYAVMRSGKMPGMPGGDPNGPDGGPGGPNGAPAEGPGGGPGGPGGPGMDEGFFSTKAENMLKLIDYLTETYGGVVEYLRLIGISEELMDRIRDKFVEL